MNNNARESNPVVPGGFNQTTLSSNGPEKDRLASTIARKLGRTLNRFISQFSAVQKRTLVWGILLLLASYFAFIFSKGVQSPTGKMDTALPHPLPPAPTLKPGPLNHQWNNQSAHAARADSASNLSVKP